MIRGEKNTWSSHRWRRGCGAVFEIREFQNKVQLRDENRHFVVHRETLLTEKAIVDKPEEKKTDISLN